MEDAPVGDGKTLPQEREDAPVEGEATHDDEADELREMERELAEVDVYKLEIQFVAGSILNLWLLSPSSTFAATSLQPLRNAFKAAISGRRRRCSRSMRQTYWESRPVASMDRSAKLWQ